MKKLLAIAFLFACMGVNAQNSSFSIKLNGKEILSRGVFPNGDGVGITLTAKQLKAGGKLQVTIKNADELSEWKRILQLNDKEGNTLNTLEKNYVSGTYDWNIPNLQALLKKHKTLVLHTYSIPVDEKKASLVRVMTFNLCSLEIKQ